MKKRIITTFKILPLAAAILGSSMFLSGCDGDSSKNTAVGKTSYEVWATDQSNSKSGAASIGTQGSSMYIWDSADVEAQIAGGATAAPMGCGADANVAGAGPCAMEDVFPGALVDETGKTLASSFGAGFARMHGSLSDPQGKYMNINMFLTGGAGGFVGIMDGTTKEAIALWQVTKTGASAGGRSVHMSFWNKDGSALFVANLHGRIIERVDITRDATGKITAANLNRGAAFSAAAGAKAPAVEDSHAYTGTNANGNALISTVSGAYDATAFADTTPNGICKENGACAVGTPDGAAGGRPWWRNHLSYRI